jgi:putative flippase GtrA
LEQRSGLSSPGGASASSVVVRPRLKGFVAYASVSALSATVFFALYNALRLVLGPLMANGIAVTASMLLSYFLTRRIVFVTVDTCRQGTLRRFVGLFLVTLFVSNLVLVLALRILPASRLLENAAIASTAIILSAVRYLWLRSWVFREQLMEGE